MDKKGYIEYTQNALKDGQKLSRPALEKAAKDFGIDNKNIVKELTELAITLNAREIAHSKLSTYAKYNAIVDAYFTQPNISFRTSKSVLLQQYSTPAPISFLASTYILSNRDDARYFEPSAGNGLLTIALPYNRTYVNEIDVDRYDNLKMQPYVKVTQKDATGIFDSYLEKFDGVITNPPFGSLETPVYFGDYKFKVLDHIMCINALTTMKDTGKAALIFGGHPKFDQRERFQGGKYRIFFNYLYHHYNVEDIISINGKQLYTRQGTGMDVTLVLINGRKDKPQGAAPLKSELNIEPINDYSSLWIRVSESLKDSTEDTQKRLRLLKVRAKAIRIMQMQNVEDNNDASQAITKEQKELIDATYNSLLNQIKSKDYPKIKNINDAITYCNENKNRLSSDKHKLIDEVVDRLKARKIKLSTERKEKREKRNALIVDKGMLKPQNFKISDEYFYKLVDAIKLAIPYLIDSNRDTFKTNSDFFKTALEPQNIWAIYRMILAQKGIKEKDNDVIPYDENWNTYTYKQGITDKQLASVIRYIIKQLQKQYTDGH